MVQEVPKRGNGAGGGDVVVVGAEDGHQISVLGECGADAGEGVGVDEYIRVDEDDNVRPDVGDAQVPSRCWAKTGRGRDHHNLFWRCVGGADRREAAIERRRCIRRRDDDTDGE